MKPIFLKIGGIKITYYGLCYAISFFLGIELGKKEGARVGISPKLIEDYAFIAMLSGLIGGRLYYVLFNASYYISRPLSIFAVWKGGMAIHGGIIGGIIGTFIFAKKNKISFFKLSDVATPLLLLGQAIGRFGNLANGEIHGVPTFTPLNVIFSFKPRFYEWYNQYIILSDIEKSKYNELVPWGLIFPSTSPAGSEFPNLPLHPAMLYEALLNFIGFIFLYFYLRKKNISTGTITFSYILIYGINRMIVSFFRAEDLMIFGLRAPHLVSLLMIIIGIIGIYFFKIDKSKEEK